MPAGPSVGPALSDQLADVQAEVRRLAMKWDKMTTAPVFEGRTRTSSPSPPVRRVTFSQPQTTRQPQPVSSYQTFNNRGMRGRNNGNGPRQPFNPRPRGNFFPQQGMAQTGQCPKCGRQNHAHPNYCAAINKMCNYCLKRGHFSKVCRAAVRSRTQTHFD